MFLKHVSFFLSYYDGKISMKIPFFVLFWISWYVKIMILLKIFFSHKYQFLLYNIRILNKWVDVFLSSCALLIIHFKHLTYILRQWTTCSALLGCFFVKFLITNVNFCHQLNDNHRNHDTVGYVAGGSLIYNIFKRKKYFRNLRYKGNITKYIKMVQLKPTKRPNKWNLPNTEKLHDLFFVSQS